MVWFLITIQRLSGVQGSANLVGFFSFYPKGTPEDEKDSSPGLG